MKIFVSKEKVILIFLPLSLLETQTVLNNWLETVSMFKVKSLEYLLLKIKQTDIELINNHPFQVELYFTKENL